MKKFIIIFVMLYTTLIAENNNSLILKTYNNSGEIVVDLNPYKQDFELNADIPTDVEFSKKMEIFVLNYNLAKTYFKNHQYNKALEHINIAIQIFNNVSIAYQLKGSIFYKQYKFLDALNNWKRALSLDPSNLKLQELIHKIEKDK